ncbi:amidohydrolase [Brevibacillus fluminis]|uniref:amidohydrolase n=1 Tax=Brevibacillus fluminis TaxID=511487 RepID=UPI001605D4AC|nr:amidohydrolase [Brevibacillus fluminis]
MGDLQGKVADIVLTSNAVFTGYGDAPRTGAVAVAGNRILAVGTEDEIRPLVGPETKVLSYEDKLIMPGFHDFHVHVLLGSLEQQCINLLSAKSEEETAQMVKAYADEHPEYPWVIGFSWYHVHWDEKKLPHRSTLDKYIPDRPVFLFNAECHGAWLNSKALELAGITRDTPDPQFGEIARDENGEPTGFLYETAMALAKQAFEFPTERRISLLQGFLDHAAQLGVTSVGDMFPLVTMELGDLDMYRQFEEMDRLSVRIHFLTELDGDLEKPRKLRETYRSEKLQFAGLKNFLDGVPTTYTGYLLEPYADRLDTCGDTLIPKHVIEDWTVQADREGFRIRYHACGDAAVRLGLDCFAEAQRQNGARDSRHTIEHIEVLHPDDLPRFSELGVIPSIQPEHLASDTFAGHTYLARLGPERSRRTWPINSLQKSGATLAFGSDFPVVGLDPITELYRAVTRLHNDGQPEGGWNPEERISMADALRAYTSGAAYGNFREHDLGTLEAGKLADIVVLDQNLFAVEHERIRDTKVSLTMMDGKIVYQKEEE